MTTTDGPDDLPLDLSLDDTPEPTPAPTEEYRYPADADPLVAGKTASEVAGMLSALAQSVGAVSAATPISAAPPPPPPAPAPAPTTPPPDHATVQQLAERQAAMTVELAQREFGDDFKRYGPEITEALANVPRHQITLDVIRRAVHLARGAHRDEYLAERLREQQQGSIFPTMRGTGGGAALEYRAPQPENVSDAAIAEWQRKARAQGISDNEVAEFERANDLPPGSFYRQFQNTWVSDGNNFDPRRDAVADVSYGRKSGSR